MTRAQVRARGVAVWGEANELVCPRLRFIHTREDWNPRARNCDEGTWVAINRDPCPKCDEERCPKCHNRGKPFDQSGRLVVLTGEEYKA